MKSGKPQLEQFYYDVEYVKKIVEPMQRVDIIGAFYHRIYPDGSTVNVTSCAKWTVLYFEKLLNRQYKHEDILNQCFGKAGINLWALNKDNQVWKDASEFEYGNGISLINDCDGFRECMGFYSNVSNKSINTFYINNLNTLKKLGQYFILQSKNIFERAEKKQTEESCLAYQKQCSVSDTLRFINQTDRRSVNFKEPALLFNQKTCLPMYLSPQRSLCLKLLIEGKSAKKIADIMKLSVRTVEYYLGLLRQELGCKTSKELISKYSDQLTR